MPGSWWQRWFCWGSASGAESRAEKEPGGSVESGQHRVSYPQWGHIGKGRYAQRGLPSVKQAEGQDAHPISALLVGPGVLRRLQAAPSASPGHQCAHSPACSIPSSLGVFTIPTRSSHCLFPYGRPPGTRTPQIIASSDQSVETPSPSPGLVQYVISNFKCTKKQENVTHSQE